MTITRAKWTIDEYYSMVDAGIRANRHVELLRGEIVEMGCIGKPHAHFSTVAGTYLVRLLGERAMVLKAKPITLNTTTSEPEPDIAVVEELGDEYLKHHPYPENIYWLIEYLNTSLDKDLKTKTKVYAEAGIIEYWVVNLKTRQLIVWSNPQNGEYTSEITLLGGTIYPLAFPDVAISVDKIVTK